VRLPNVTGDAAPWSEGRFALQVGRARGCSGAAPHLRGRPDGARRHDRAMAKRLVTITVSGPGFTANETFASRADGQAWREMIEATLSHREKDDFDLALYAAGLASLSRFAALLYDSAAGFDISSFQTDGSQKRIEVKTTQGPVSTPFFISLNEVLASREAPLTYSIYACLSITRIAGG